MTMTSLCSIEHPFLAVKRGSPAPSLPALCTRSHFRLLGGGERELQALEASTQAEDRASQVLREISREPQDKAESQEPCPSARAPQTGIESLKRPWL